MKTFVQIYKDEDQWQDDALNPYHEDYSGPGSSGELFYVLNRVCNDYVVYKGTRDKSKSRAYEVVKVAEHVRDLYTIAVNKYDFKDQTNETLD